MRSYYINFYGIIVEQFSPLLSKQRGNKYTVFSDGQLIYNTLDADPEIKFP